MKPKIIQILIAPNDACWQGKLIGLGDDGVTYHANEECVWEPLISPLEPQINPNIPEILESMRGESCVKSCGPGDWREGGKCDREGCFPRQIDQSYVDRACGKDSASEKAEKPVDAS